MTKFYSSAIRMGKHILYRGYENGQQVKKRIPFQPKLYVSSQNESEWKTLDGLPVAECVLDSMSDATDFLKKYDGVHNFKVYGNNNYVAQYIGEQFPNKIEFDRDLIRTANIDIEVYSKDGFPEQARPHIQ